MWIYISKSYLCSRVLAAVCSGRPICLGGKQCATWSGTLTLPKFYRPESKTECCATRQFGPTCQPSTLTRGQAASTLLAPDSPVSHSASPAQWAQGSTKGTGGPIPPELFATLDQPTSIWKTSQGCLPGLMGISASYSTSWPRSGMMRDGGCYLLPPLGRLTEETGSGLLATPTATGNQLSPSMMKHPGCRLWLPTPKASDGEKGGRGDLLGKQIGLSMTVQGSLNPVWVEWLMGWPNNWTSLGPMAPKDFADWLASHGAEATPWGAETAERVTTSCKSRANRIRAIGNGQVPLVAATAWLLCSVLNTFTKGNL